MKIQKCLLSFKPRWRDNVSAFHDVVEFNFLLLIIFFFSFKWKNAIKLLTVFFGGDGGGGG